MRAWLPKVGFGTLTALVVKTLMLLLTLVEGVFITQLRMLGGWLI